MELDYKWNFIVLCRCLEISWQKLNDCTNGTFKKCRNEFETMISEALLIKRYNPILNKQLFKPGITHTLTVFDYLDLFCITVCIVYVTCFIIVVYNLNL